jgi:hypothetical protein
MCDLAVDICFWFEDRGVTLFPRHILGHLNVLADHLYRKDQILKTEWSLNQIIAGRIFHLWGSTHVDVFALEMNTRLVTYISPIPEPQA